MGKYYLTTAIPYVNAAPHLGHALEFIQADVIARYRVLRGDEVFLVTGADENSLKNVQAAEARGITPEKLCEENAAQFKRMSDVLRLSYTNFVRTSVSEAHRKGVQKMWEECLKSGDIYKKKYRGLYCVGCESFYEEHELVNGMCPEHMKPPEVVEEENYFFRLSRYQEKLLQMIESGQITVIPESRKNEVVQFIKNGLNDFSISRSSKRARGWGIQVPNDPSQIMYVWFDALGTYITGIGYGTKDEMFNKYWPADVHVIGKGIVRFHAIYWPAMLLSAGISPPKRILVHGYITVEGQKMSKSLGNVVDPFNVVDKYGLDAFRYCLMSEVSTFDDGDFNERILVEKNNNELVANVGNFVNRTIVFINSKFDSKVPLAKLSEADYAFLSRQREVVERITELLDQFRLKDALSSIMEFSSNANRYFQENEPWKIINSDRERAGTVLNVLVNQVKDLAILLWPYVPTAAEEMFAQLGIERRGWDDLCKLSIESNHVVNKAKPIFRKFEFKVERKEISVSEVDLEVVEILSVEKHPAADKLFIERVRTLDGERQIVSGLVGYYKPEELVGRKVILVKNLRPAVLRGVRSEGMLLAAISGNDVEVLFCDECNVGDKVEPQGEKCTYRKEVSIDEFAKLNLEVRDYKFLADGKEMLVGGKQVVSKRIRNGKVG